ncbi:hypothetical protein F4780DRAFT_172350 [Xylariomycetidae sp. FL0641]|nr:hypothetical protein F4780DRAFT_172350 [Xylariomycetidae sp. FL0641]
MFEGQARREHQAQDPFLYSRPRGTVPVPSSVLLFLAHPLVLRPLIFPVVIVIACALAVLSRRLSTHWWTPRRAPTSSRPTTAIQSLDHSIAGNNWPTAHLISTRFPLPMRLDRVGRSLISYLRIRQQNRFDARLSYCGPPSFHTPSASPRQPSDSRIHSEPSSRRCFTCNCRPLKRRIAI